MASSSNLCDDIIRYEIFPRTSLSTFNAMRCLSREFDALGYNGYVQSLRKATAKYLSGFLLQSSNRASGYVLGYSPSQGTPSLNLGFLPHNTQILSSSEYGLVVFEIPHCRIGDMASDIPYRRIRDMVFYHVSKPATRQIIGIPNPKTRFPTRTVSIVAMSSIKFRYKILRLSAGTFIKTHGVTLWPVRLELFDSLTWVWKHFDVVKFPCCVSPYTEPPIVVSGKIYILFTHYEIMVFNVYTENYTMIKPPSLNSRESRVKDHRTQLVKFDRSLGLGRMWRNGSWKIWLLTRDGWWRNTYVLRGQVINSRLSLSFDEPTAILRVYYKVYLFFKDKIPDHVCPVNKDLFVLKSDFEPVNLSGR